MIADTRSSSCWRSCLFLDPVAAVIDVRCDSVPPCRQGTHGLSPGYSSCAGRYCIVDDDLLPSHPGNAVLPELVAVFEIERHRFNNKLVACPTLPLAHDVVASQASAFRREACPSDPSLKLRNTRRSCCEIHLSLDNTGTPSTWNRCALKSGRLALRSSASAPR